MKRKSILILIFLLAMGSLFSQSEFRNGYIIKNNNDTIYGYIDYKGDLSSSKKCIFKKEIASEKLEFLPEEIISYRFIDSKYYVSRLLETDAGEEFVFFEYLIDGIVDIFYYRNEQGDHYFMDQGDGRLIELKNMTKEVYFNNKKYLKESKEYIGVLKYAFKESPKQSKKVDNLLLSHKSLIRIAKDYHDEVCTTAECVIYEKVSPKNKLSFGPVIGLNYRSTSVWNKFNENLNYLNNANFEDEVFPSFGFFVKINLPSINERLFFKYEGTFSKWDMQSVNSWIDTYSLLIYTEKIILKQNAINSVGIIRYEFPEGKKIRPAFQAGGFFSFYTNIDYAITRDITRPEEAEPFYSTKNTNSPFNKIGYGIDLGVGSIISLKKMWDINVDLRYKYGTGLHYGISTHNVSLVISLQIGK